MIEMTNRQAFELLTEKIHQRRAVGLEEIFSEADYCAIGIAALSDPDGKPFAKKAA